MDHSRWKKKSLDILDDMNIIKYMFRHLDAKKYLKKIFEKKIRTTNRNLSHKNRRTYKKKKFDDDEAVSRCSMSIKR